MPYFREPVSIDRRFDGNALGALRDAGYGDRINIVNAAYTVPDGEKSGTFLDSSAEALDAVSRLVNLQPDGVYMMRDAGVNSPNLAALAFSKTVVALYNEDPSLFVKLSPLPNDKRMKPFGWPNFDEYIDSPERPKIYIKTMDELPFACASVLVAHSSVTYRNRNPLPFLRLSTANR